MVLAQPTFHPFKDFLYFCNQEGVITQLLSSALPIFCAQRGNNPSKRVTHFFKVWQNAFQSAFFLKVCPLQKNVHFVVDSLMRAHTEGSFDLLYIKFFFGYKICCMLEIFVIAIFVMHCTKRVTFREKTPF